MKFKILFRFISYIILVMGMFNPCTYLFLIDYSKQTTNWHELSNF